MRSFTRGSSIGKGTESGIRSLEYRGMAFRPTLGYLPSLCVSWPSWIILSCFFSWNSTPGHSQELLWRVEVEVRLRTGVRLARASPLSPIVTPSAGDQCFPFQQGTSYCNGETWRWWHLLSPSVSLGKQLGPAAPEHLCWGHTAVGAEVRVAWMKAADLSRRHTLRLFTV